MKSYLSIDKLILWTGIFIAGMFMFEGCQVDHSIDPHKYGRIYMYQALKSPVEVSATVGLDTTTTIVYGAAYGGPERSGGDILVSFSVDPSLVDSFNIKNLTSYSILPEKCYTLSDKQANIPADNKATSAFEIKIDGNVKISEGIYLLPITVKVNGGEKANGSGMQINKSLQTAYFIINVHEFRVVAEDHHYTAVFSDDALNPHYLYFIGIPKDSTEQMVWKYDLIGDSLLDEFPRRVANVFSFPYPQKMPDIEAVGWLFLSKRYQHPKLYFWGNKNLNYYTYDLATQNAGPLKMYKDLAKKGGPDHWPDKHFPKRIDASFYLPGKAAVNRKEESYLFAGKYFEWLWPGGAWRYPGTGHHLVWAKEPHPFPEQWHNFPITFAQQRVSGVYYDNASETLQVFSEDEFVVIDMKMNKKFFTGELGKITNAYEGL